RSARALLVDKAALGGRVCVMPRRRVMVSRSGCHAALGPPCLMSLLRAERRSRILALSQHLCQIGRTSAGAQGHEIPQKCPKGFKRPGDIDIGENRGSR